MCENFLKILILTAKREVSATDLDDPSSSESVKKIKITHPLSSASRTKHVSFEDLPAKLKKTIESALNDALLRKKVNDNDYLKIYYGDKVIKIPVAISKKFFLKSKETTTTKSVVETYAHKNLHKIPKEEEENSFKSSFFPEAPTSYYYPSTTEKAQSYVNFVTPKDPSPHVEEVHIPKKSFYFFSSEEETTPKSLVPIISSTPSSSLGFSDLSSNYESHVLHGSSSPSLGAYKTVLKELPKESIPITEETVVNNYLYKPKIKFIDDHKFLPAPTSDSEFDDKKEEEKNYEFG